MLLPYTLYLLFVLYILVTTRYIFMHANEFSTEIVLGDRVFHTHSCSLHTLLSFLRSQLCYHRYPVWLAFIPLHWTPGSMSGEWEGWLSFHDIRL